MSFYKLKLPGISDGIITDLTIVGARNPHRISEAA